MEKIFKVVGGCCVIFPLIVGFITQAMVGNLLGLFLCLIGGLFPALLFWGIAAILERLNDLEELILTQGMEEKEDLSPCPKCGKDVEISRKSCPFCGTRR